MIAMRLKTRMNKKNNKRKNHWWPFKNSFGLFVSRNGFLSLHNLIFTNWYPWYPHSSKLQNPEIGIWTKEKLPRHSHKLHMSPKSYQSLEFLKYLIGSILLIYIEAVFVVTSRVIENCTPHRLWLTSLQSKVWIILFLVCCM